MSVLTGRNVIFTLHNVMHSSPTESLATIMLGSATSPSTRHHARTYALDRSPANSYSPFRLSLPSRIARLVIATS